MVIVLKHGLVIKAQKYEVARAGLSVLFILFLDTFGENLEILAYLYWSGLIIIGLALKPLHHCQSKLRVPNFY